MTDYNLGRVVGTDGTGIQSIASILEATGRTKVVITLTTGTTETFYIEKGTKGDTGTGIRTIELISTVGKDKNYQITFTDNSTFDYTISDGEDAVCDTELDIESENAVQNKVITGAINTINTTLETKFDEKGILQLLHDYGHVSDSPVTRITLESDKDILSYADGDVATLTATVYDNSDNPVRNQIVVFYKNGKVLDTGVTDTNGEATYEYESEGSGDIVFGASVGRFFIETYSIEDCWVYSSQEYVQPPTSSDWSDVINGLSFENTGEWELSFDLKVTDNSTRVEINAIHPPTQLEGRSWGVGINVSGNIRNFIEKTSNGSQTNYDDNTYGSFSKNTYHTVSQIMSNGKLSAYFDNNLLKTIDDPFFSSYQTLYFNWRNWGNSSTTYVTNLKIKPL